MRWHWRILASGCRVFHDESQLTIGEVDGEYQVRVVSPIPGVPDEYIDCG